MAAREGELVTGARDLDLRKEELKTEVEQRLAEAEKKHQAALGEVTKEARDARRKEEDARKEAEDAEKGLLAERDTTRKLRDQAKLDGQRTSELEKSLKLKEDELSSLTAKLLELGENHSRVSSELAEIHQIGRASCRERV